MHVCNKSAQVYTSMTALIIQLTIGREMKTKQTIRESRGERSEPYGKSLVTLCLKNKSYRERRDKGHRKKEKSKDGVTKEM